VVYVLGLLYVARGLVGIWRGTEWWNHRKRIALPEGITAFDCAQLMRCLTLWCYRAQSANTRRYRVRTTRLMHTMLECYLLTLPLPEQTPKPKPKRRLLTP
jgi:hypothetical protein